MTGIAAPVAQVVGCRAAGLGLAAVLAVVLLLPTGAGLLGTMVPAFGYLPAAGARDPGLWPWRDLMSSPGFLTGLRLTVTTGVGATALSLTLAVALCISLHRQVRLRAARLLLAPMLASPHSAMAIGLAFVLAPSGWLARLASSWLTGRELPADVSTIHDSGGIALVLGLLVKEVPFLSLVILAAVEQVPVAALLRTCRALGYGPTATWIKVVMPQVYPQVRLPVYAVLAFSLSVVDVALVLGPANPATLSVTAARWFAAPDVSRYPAAAAAAAMLLAVVVVAIALWWGVERLVAAAGRVWIARGGRSNWAEPVLGLMDGPVILTLAMGAAALLAMAVWSFTWRWSFPNPLPQEWGISNWLRAPGLLAGPLANTVALGSSTTVAAVALAVACFEADDACASDLLKTMVRLAMVPLLLPQVAFQFGAQILLLRLRLDGGIMAVGWYHLVFVFPYVVIALADPWRAIDPRYARSAASLNASRMRVLFAVKLPILLRPLMVAAAIGFSVSVAQYLPTLFAGGGRVATLTTEAVALSSGGDRRITGMLVILQSGLPLLAFAAAMAIPPLLHGKRRREGEVG